MLFRSLAARSLHVKHFAQSGLICTESTSKIGMAIVDPHLFRNTIFVDLWILNGGNRCRLAAISPTKSRKYETRHKQSIDGLSQVGSKVQHNSAAELARVLESHHSSQLSRRDCIAFDKAHRPRICHFAQSFLHCPSQSLLKKITRYPQLLPRSSPTAK